VVALGVITVDLAAVALPRWVHTGSRPLNSDATTGLKTAFTAQKGFFQEKDRFGDTWDEVGFEWDRGSRFAFFLADDGPLRDRSAQAEVAPDGGAVIIGSDAFRGYTRVVGPFSKTGCPLTLKRATPGLALQLGRVHTKVEDEAVVMTAAGNIDDDPTLDCWSIATVDRVAASGELISAGVPFHEQDDTEH
jgi:type IV pilus assembly protein PilA